MDEKEKVLADTRIAILATDGFEQSELEIPVEMLTAHGATVEVVSLDEGSIRGWREHAWGREVEVDRVLERTTSERYAALVLPGGQINPDSLREVPEAVQFIKDFASTNKPIAAICHATSLLVEAELVRGREVTSYQSIRTDVVNAGGNWVDQAVVVDGNLITSRKPDDLEVFCDALIDKLAHKGVLAAE